MWKGQFLRCSHTLNWEFVFRKKEVFDYLFADDWVKQKKFVHKLKTFSRRKTKCTHKEKAINYQKTKRKKKNVSECEMEKKITKKRKQNIRNNLMQWSHAPKPIVTEYERYKIEPLQQMKISYKSQRFHKLK